MVGNQAYQKAVNLALIMRAIRGAPGISRTEIAAATGLTKSAVGNLVREILARGIVTEVGLRNGNGPNAGRPRIGLEVVADAVHVVGVELRPDLTTTATVDLLGTVVARSTSATPGVRNLAERWHRVAHEIGAGVSGTCLRVGLAVPATVDPTCGRVVAAEDPEFDGFVVESVPTPRGECKVLVENDANAVAWGASARTGGPARNLLVVTGRREAAGGRLRVGTAVVIDGRVFYGADFGGGEFRSFRWRRGMGSELAASDEGDRAALRELLENLAAPVSMLRPERVIVAGDLVPAMPTIEELLRDELAGSAVDPVVSGVSFVPAVDGRSAVAVGAARMVLEHLFRVPTPDRPAPAAAPRWSEVLAIPAASE